MEKQNSTISKPDERAKGSCNVNSTFNFSVGAVAIAIAGIIGYFIYNFLTK